MVDIEGGFLDSIYWRHLYIGRFSFLGRLSCLERKCIMLFRENWALLYSDYLT